ncbi:hypothetical protein Cgig2_018738 [Carnegiea gigantea]|uniref:DNA-directed RNA polymerase n=1 Tax=Carnegiea gigantea TaxID=171969 RepID=A0A9Q1GVL2_9CARY|nr:hypothetical protein Cgig2_018738 [Carnegiea gigantea]
MLGDRDLIDYQASEVTWFALGSQHRSSPLKHRGLAGETAVVDRVALFSDENSNLCVNLVSRQIRRPEVGDKYSSRHGQKRVCGAIVQQEDLVFSERGICPDLITNPHEFAPRPRMQFLYALYLCLNRITTECYLFECIWLVTKVTTCCSRQPSDRGSLMEILGSKAAASCGRFHHGTAFGEHSGHAARVEDISETLVKHGFSNCGKYSGVFGSPLKAYIFMGPIYYQKLKHMVIDKMRVCGRSKRDNMTRQPTQDVGNQRMTAYQM